MNEQWCAAHAHQHKCRLLHIDISVFSSQIEAQLAEYHKLARKLKLIPKGAENSKGYDFEIKFNPEAGANCLVKYRTQVYVSMCSN